MTLAKRLISAVEYHKMAEEEIIEGKIVPSEQVHQMLQNWK